MAEILQQQIDALIDQMKLVNAASDAQVERMKRMDDYEKFQSNFMEFKSKIGDDPHTHKEKPLIDPKELAVGPFEGDNLKFKDFIEDSRVYF